MVPPLIGPQAVPLTARQEGVNRAQWTTRLPWVAVFIRIMEHRAVDGCHSFSLGTVCRHLAKRGKTRLWYTAALRRGLPVHCRVCSSCRWRGMYRPLARAAGGIAARGFLASCDTSSPNRTIFQTPSLGPSFALTCPPIFWPSFGRNRRRDAFAFGR